MANFLHSAGYQTTVVTDVSHTQYSIGPDSELVELVWLPISEAKSQDLPTITQVALDELQARVAKGFGHDLPSPFYRMLHRKFVRAEL